MNYLQKIEKYFDSAFDAFKLSLNNFDFCFVSNRSRNKSNITENEKEYIFTLEMPGVNKDDLEIFILNNYLSVRKKGEYEDLYSVFLNNEILKEQKKILAKLELGILTILIPKKEAEKYNILIE